MKIHRIIAVIILSANVLIMTPQPAKAGSFYFQINFGNDLYSFYPYDYSVWPVYGYHHFSSPFYGNHLHYYYPLIGFYQPVFYYPLVPYSFTRSYYAYPHRFYQHVYSYYRHRPFLYHRYQAPGQRRQQHTYYKPERKYYRHARQKPAPLYTEKKHQEPHNKSYTKKYHYTNRDFDHLGKIDDRHKFRSPHVSHKENNDAGKLQKSQQRQKKKESMEVADRLIKRNQTSYRQQNNREKYQAPARDYRRYSSTRRISDRHDQRVQHSQENRHSGKSRVTRPNRGQDLNDRKQHPGQRHLTNKRNNIASTGNSRDRDLRSRVDTKYLKALHQKTGRKPVQVNYGQVNNRKKDQDYKHYQRNTGERRWNSRQPLSHNNARPLKQQRAIQLRR